MAKKAQERRLDSHGEIRMMAEADGYVMARRKGATPFVVSRKRWDRYPEVEQKREAWCYPPSSPIFDRD